VKNGSYTEHGKSSSKVYTYVREDEKQKILVVCSFSEKNVKFTAPKDFDVGAAELILTNYETNESMILKPYETRVYLLNK
jgi:oligo-1,6-glucosidase